MQRFAPLFVIEQIVGFGGILRQERAFIARVTQVSQAVFLLKFTLLICTSISQLVKAGFASLRQPMPLATPMEASSALPVDAPLCEAPTYEEIFATTPGTIAPPSSPSSPCDSRNRIGSTAGSRAGLIRTSRKADRRMMNQMRAYAERAQDSDVSVSSGSEEDEDSEDEFLGFSARRRTNH
jgi:hypothetical protein